MGNDQADFTPNERMEKGAEGWVWKCPKHKDPSKEATVQALIKLGLWESQDYDRQDKHPRSWVPRIAYCGEDDVGADKDESRKDFHSRQS